MFILHSFSSIIIIRIYSGAATSTIEEEVDIHELFMKEVEKNASTKPDIITHVLDGFYIQESYEPFPIDAYGCIEALVPHEAIQNLYAPAAVSTKAEKNGRNFDALFSFKRAPGVVFIDMRMGSCA